MIHDIALGLGAAITGIVLSSFAGVLIGKWMALANIQQHRRVRQQQPPRNGDAEGLRSVPVGGEVQYFHVEDTTNG